MGDERRDDAGQESWTDIEEARPEMVEAAPIRHGMVLGGRYAIERIIGRGGSGVVVRAHDRDLNQEVAIKIVRAELAGQRVWATRLAREVRLARQIHHPHVCRVFDFQQADGRVFLVMELAEKGTLRDEIRSGRLKARPLGERIADARAVASALAAIHAAGIVHRDLSPQNLLRLDDGRLVLSDFGLATDASESTSLHGGTIAYMAPEVMRGEGSTAASDIWSLGVLMYEIVFGDKPRWSEGASPEILTPALGRKPSAEERAVLDTCRACTAKEPAKRLASAAAAARMLTERRRWRFARIAAARRPVVWAGALTVLAGGAVGMARMRQQRPDGRSVASPESSLIVATGEPADWTDVSTMLAEAPDRITCIVGLPDKRSLRFVWGNPRRAEDVDTESHRRFPSPLVPAAYAEGCPDLSPDGKRLVYQGHLKDGRAFAFVSEHADGRDGRPIVATGEPSYLSDPRWLADGKSFSYDVDTRHIGIFSLETNRAVVVPGGDDGHVSAFRWTMGNQVFLQKVFFDERSELIGHLWPSLVEVAHLRTRDYQMDLRSADGSTYYYTRVTGGAGVIVALTLASRLARNVGAVRGQSLRHPIPVDAGLSFVSVKFTSEVAIRDGLGSYKRVRTGSDINAAVKCGRGLLTSEFIGDRSIINRRSSDGTLVGTLTDGPSDLSPSCSTDGRSWCYARRVPRSGIVCRDDQGRERIIDRPAVEARISPDARRVVFVASEKRGLGIYVSDTGGADIREVTETEAVCAPGWSSIHTIWISRRRGKEFAWIEMDIDSGKETGRTKAGTMDCANGDEDPARPFDLDVRRVAHSVSQVRVLPSRYLRAE